MFGLFIKRHAEAVACFNEIAVLYVHGVNQLSTRYELDKEMNNGVTEYRVYYKKSNSIPLYSKIVNQWRFLKANIKGLTAAEQQQKFDLIHVHILTRLGLLGCFFALRRGIPFMITEHWSRYLPVNNGFNGVLRKWISRFVVKRAAMVTTVTNDLMQAMKSYKLLNNNYVVLPNVVDMELFQPLEKPPHKTVNFVHVSCFEDKSKNVSGLLRALAELSTSGSDFTFTFVGDGMDFEALQKLAQDLKIKNCLFTGLLEGSVLAQTISKADALVLFSNYENMPVVILEALACGIPVIATRVGGIKEMVNEENGILVDAGDEKALLLALLKMTKTFADYNPEALRKTVFEKYGMKSVGMQLNKWYDEAIDAKAP